MDITQHLQQEGNLWEFFGTCTETELDQAIEKIKYSNSITTPDESSYVVQLFNSRLFKLPWFLHNTLCISLTVTLIMLNSCFHFLWSVQFILVIQILKLLNISFFPYMPPVSRLMVTVIPAQALPVNTDLYSHYSTSCLIISVPVYMLCYLRSWSVLNFPRVPFFFTLKSVLKAWACRVIYTWATLSAHYKSIAQLHLDKFTLAVFDANFYPWFEVSQGTDFAFLSVAD